MVARQQHQQAGLWVADEGEEEDAAHICREEELTFPWEREVWELPSLCLSDGIPACSIMKVTGISEIADRCLEGKKKMPGACCMAEEFRAGSPFLSSGVHGPTPSLTGGMAGPCHHALATATGTHWGIRQPESTTFTP